MVGAGDWPELSGEKVELRCACIGAGGRYVVTGLDGGTGTQLWTWDIPSWSGGVTGLVLGADGGLLLVTASAVYRVEGT